MFNQNGNGFALRVALIREACGSHGIGSKVGRRERGRQWKQEFWGGKQHHRLEITSIKLGPKILDIPFPHYFSEELLLLWASVYKVRKKMLLNVVKSKDAKAWFHLLAV